MNTDFSGKAGIVTGASSGFGRLIAQALGKAGMELWLVGRSEEELEHTAMLIKDSGGKEPHCSPMDLSEKGVLSDLVNTVGNSHPYLSVLVNNAGIMHPEPILDPEADPQRWHDMFLTNVLTPMEGCKAAVEVMRKHGRPGNLINISSISSKEELYGAYGVSKAAVNHMGRTLRHELEGDDIRITTIIPGGFATNLARSFKPEALQKMAEVFVGMGIDPESPEARKLIGDPVHIANAVMYILQQPVELNIEEISIRPATTLQIG